MPKRGDNWWEQGYKYVIFILVYGEKREGDWRELWCKKEYDMEQATDD